MTPSPLHVEFDAPLWMTIAGIATLRDGYLLQGETVRGMFRRISSTAAKRSGMPEVEQSMFDALDNGYICLSSPILSNFGTDRGLPISCYGQAIGDSIHDIYSGITEFAMLSKNGGGVSQYFGHVRPANTPIKGGANGMSNGSVPFAKCYDSAVVAVSQGSVRRGANAFYWPSGHGDRKQALKIRRQVGSEMLQCLNSNHAFVFDDKTMDGIVSGSNQEDREFWTDLIKTRIETGEPYIMFEGASNRMNSERLTAIYQKHGLKNLYSNICTEILLPADPDHTFVCCISSLALHKFKEWKGKGVVRLMVILLDAVMDEFIEKASEIPALEKAVRFAKKSRAIGIGVLGYHTFLQEQGLPFNSLPARSWNKVMFRHIREEAEKASLELGQKRGEPLWCEGTGFRNTHLMAVAPTATNSIISGHVSPGIEPWSANIFAHKTAKGSFIVKNTSLEALLETLGQNTDEVWKKINSEGGSVRGLEFLTAEQKETFLTAYEMDMRDIVDAAADRQEFIDQGQSLNFFFDPPRKGEREPEATFTDRVRAFYRHVNECHIRAWKKGLKTIYYCRSKPVSKADSASRGHERQKIEDTTKAPDPIAIPTAEPIKEQPIVQPVAAMVPDVGETGEMSQSGDDCKFCEG